MGWESIIDQILKVSIIILEDTPKAVGIDVKGEANVVQGCVVNIQKVFT